MRMLSNGIGPLALFGLVTAVHAASSSDALLSGSKNTLISTAHKKPVAVSPSIRISPSSHPRPVSASATADAGVSITSISSFGVHDSSHARSIISSERSNFGLSSSNHPIPVSASANADVTVSPGVDASIRTHHSPSIRSLLSSERSKLSSHHASSIRSLASSERSKLGTHTRPVSAGASENAGVKASASVHASVSTHPPPLVRKDLSSQESKLSSQLSDERSKLSMQLSSYRSKLNSEFSAYASKVGSELSSARSRAHTSVHPIRTTQSTTQPNPTPAYRYLDCFNYTATNQPLPAHIPIQDLTLEACASACIDSTYFGVALGTFCSCGNAISPSTPTAPASHCVFPRAHPCPGNPSEACGPSHAMAVYGQVGKIGACKPGVKSCGTVVAGQQQTGGGVLP